MSLEARTIAYGRRVLLAVCVLLTLALFTSAFWFLPDIMVWRALAGSKKSTDVAIWLKAVTDTRASFATFLAGIAGLLTAVGVYANYSLTKRSIEDNRSNFGKRLDAEMFQKACELLDTEGSRSLGGVMLLGELAKKQRYYWPSIEVLSHFVIRRSKGEPGIDDDGEDFVFEIDCPSEVQSALYILTDTDIRKSDWEGRWKPNISGVRLRNINLQYAEISRLCIEHSLLVKSNFVGSTFSDVELSGTEFIQCSFDNCVFDTCDLKGARFRSCSLKGSQFIAPKGVNPMTESDILKQGGAIVTRASTQPLS